MDAAEILNITGYASQEECIEAERDFILSSKNYSDWTKDSDSFNSDEANICLDELKSIRSEAECNGSMDYSSVLLSCITADNFPERFADAVCLSIFECIDSGSIQLFTGYDNLDECQEQWERDFLNGDDYDSWEENDAVFNQANAKSCLTEISEVREDSSCNGNMDIITFITDVSSDDCDSVYE